MAAFSNTLLFLSSHIKYTTKAKETLRLLPCNPFLFAVRPLMALLKVDIFLLILSQHLILLHNRDVYSQAKKRWLWVSSCCWQSVHWVSGKRILNLSLVFSFPSTASHKMRLCLGSVQTSHTTLLQWITSLLSLKYSQVWAEKVSILSCQLCITLIASLVPLHSLISCSFTWRIDFQRREVDFWKLADHISLWWER